MSKEAISFSSKIHAVHGFGESEVVITVDDTTKLIGGAIVSETDGGLDLVTGKLEVEDVAINDYARDEYTGGQVNVNIGGVISGDIDHSNDTKEDDLFNENKYGTVEHSDVGHDKEGVIKGTISGGSVTVGGERDEDGNVIGGEVLDVAKLEDMGINTDADNIITITKDESWEESFKVDLINVGVVAEQVDNLVNVVESFTAKVPDHVLAQGKAAEDLWRKAVANGKSQNEATNYINSAPAQELIGWRNKIQNKIDDKGGIDAMTHQEVSLLLQQEVVSFADHIYQENCASGPIGIGVCDDFAAGYGISTEDLTDPDVLAGLISKLSTDINSLESDTDKTKMHDLLNLAIDCSQKWIDSMSQPDNPNYIHDEGKRREYVDNFVNSNAFPEVVDALNAANGVNVPLKDYAAIYKAQTGTLDSIEQKYLDFGDVRSGVENGKSLDTLRKEVKQAQGSAYSEEQFLAEVAYFLIHENAPKNASMHKFATQYWQDPEVSENLNYDVAMLNELNDEINSGKVPAEYQGISNTDQAVKMLEKFGYDNLRIVSLNPNEPLCTKKGQSNCAERVGSVVSVANVDVVSATDPITGEDLHVMVGSANSIRFGLHPEAEYGTVVHEMGHVLQSKHLNSLINNLDSSDNLCSSGNKLCQDTRTLMVSALYYHNTSGGAITKDYVMQPKELSNHTISALFGRRYPLGSPQSGAIENLYLMWQNQK